MFNLLLQALDKPDLEDSDTLTIAMAKQFVDKTDLEDSATRTTQLGVNLAGDQPSMEQINKKRKRYSALAADLFTLFLDEDQSQESTTLTNKKRRAYHTIPKNHDWAELPEDALSIIFQKLGFFEVLVSAQQVCRSWRQVALDPSALCWRCIDMRCLPDVDSQSQDVTSCLIKQENLTKLAIDRSGHVEELCLMSVTDDFLTCITNRTPRLRCCTLIWCYQIEPEGLFNFFSRCPLLEELHVYECLFSHESYKCIGLACPQLKCLHIDGFLRKQEFHWDSEDEYDDLCRGGRKYPDYTESDFDLDFGFYCSSDSDSDSELYPSSDLDGEFFRDSSFDPEPDSNSRKFRSIDDKMVSEKANMSIPSCGSEVAPRPRFKHEMENNPNSIDDNMALETAIVLPIPSCDTNLELYPESVNSRSKLEPETKFDSFDDSVALEITDNMSIPSNVSDLDPYPEIGPDLTFEHRPKPNFGSIDDSVPLKIANNTSIPSRDSDLKLYPDVGLDPRFECEPTLNSNSEDDILALEITNNISIPNSDSNLDHYLDIGLDPRFKSEPDGNFDCVDDSVAPEISDSMSTGDADLELCPEVGPGPIYEHEPALNSVFADDRVALEIADNSVFADDRVALEIADNSVFADDRMALEIADNSVFADDRMALEIADNMRQLHNLHLIRNFNLTNKGVHAILDKCLHLESLNISCCFDVHVDEALQVKLTKIKSVRLSRRSQYHQQCN